MTKEEYEEAMRKAAREAGVSVDDDVVGKIAAFRARADIPMDKCPCDPDNPNRGCVGKDCMNEMMFGDRDKEGRQYCHCHCFYLAFNALKKSPWEMK